MQHAPIGTEINRASQLLQAGEVVAIPTETVYGLAADALNPTAVAKIFEAKSRPHFDPLIVHIENQSQLNSLVKSVPDVYRRLMDNFWPGPLTLVFEKSALVPDLVTSGLSTVAIRMPVHPTTQELLRKCGCPLAAPSANRFGCTSPTTALHVANQLGDRIPYILDGGPSTVGVESTIVREHAGKLEVLRPGGVTFEELAAVAEAEVIPFRSQQDHDNQPAVPGQLPEHYAPQTPLVIWNSELFLSQNHRLALLQFASDSGPDPSTFAVVETLSATGDLVEATARFFAALHDLDRQECEAIVAVPFPDHGLGVALNDRLRRAAASTPPDFAS